MNEDNHFQRENPLSPKKILKKIVQRLPLIILISWVLALVIYISVFYFAYLNSMPALGGWSMILFPITLFLFPVIGLIGYIPYVTKYIKTYHYDVSDHFVTIQKGVFSSHEIHIPFERVLDVSLNQDFFDALFGIYDVRVMTTPFTTNEDAHIDGVSKMTAEKIKQSILSKVSSGLHAEKKDEALSYDFSGEYYNVSTKWLIKRFLFSLLFALIPVLFVWVGVFWPERINKPTLPDAFELALNEGAILSTVYIVSVGTLFLYSLFIKKTSSYKTLSNYLEFTKSSLLGTREKHVPYIKIVKVSTKQGIVDILLDIATIDLEVTGYEQDRETSRLLNTVSLFGLNKKESQYLTQLIRTKSLTE